MSRGLALSYPGVPAPLDVNFSTDSRGPVVSRFSRVSASSLDVDSAGTQKQAELRGCAARLQDLETSGRRGGRCRGDRHGAAWLSRAALQDRGHARNVGAGHGGQPAVNSLGAKFGTRGIVSAWAARLIQAPRSRLAGRRGALGCARRSSEEAPPRQVGAARRVGRGPAVGRRRGLSGIHASCVSGAAQRAGPCVHTSAASMPTQLMPDGRPLGGRRTNCVLFGGQDPTEA